MIHSLKARWRLMRRRFKKRLRPAIALSLIFAGIATTLDWIGFLGGPLGSYHRTRIEQPHSLSEIWWHFFAFAGFCFALGMLWPFRWTPSAGSMEP